MADQVVVGSTRKDLIIALQDDLGAVINITSGTVTLQGSSPDLPATTINQAGSITDGPNGLCKWTGIGAYITAGNLGTKPSATYNLRVKYTDAASKLDYTSAFQITWLPTPV